MWASADYQLIRYLSHALKEIENAVEVIDFGSFEHFFKNLDLVVEKIFVELTQSFGEVINHFSETFLKVLDSYGAFINEF